MGWGVTGSQSEWSAGRVVDVGLQHFCFKSYLNV